MKKVILIGISTETARGISSPDFELKFADLVSNVPFDAHVVIIDHRGLTQKIHTLAKQNTPRQFAQIKDEIFKSSWRLRKHIEAGAYVVCFMSINGERIIGDKRYRSDIWLPLRLSIIGGGGTKVGATEVDESYRALFDRFAQEGYGSIWFDPAQVSRVLAKSLARNCIAGK